MKLKRGKTSLRNVTRLAILGLLFLFISAYAQELTLPVYELTIDHEDLEALLANPYSNETKPAVLIFDGTDYPCEVRFRGATGRDLPKKSWKVDFEDEGPLGWEETNLNAEYRDRSLMRNKLCMDLSRVMGVPAPESRFISLKVNGQYWGVHHEIESIDEDFFERRDLDAESIFKAVAHACRFAPLFQPERITEFYEPKLTQRGSVDTLASRFVFFQNAPLDEIQDYADEMVDIDNVLRYFAVQFAVVDHDGYTKNFYISEDDERRYRLYPWDCDATLGNDWLGDFVYSASDLDMGVLVAQALFQRLIALDEYCDQFHALLDDVIADGFDTLAVHAQQYHDLIQHDICLDTLKRGTNEEFETALSDILGFLSERRDALTDLPHLTRFEVDDYSPSSDHLGVVGDPFYLSAHIEGDPQDVYAILTDESDNDYWVHLKDDGSNGDSVAGDHYFSRIVILENAYPQFYYSFRIVPRNGLGVSYWPPAGDFNYWYYPLDLPVIGYDSAPTMPEHVEIEAAVQTQDMETHAVVIRNVSNRNIQLSGYVIRIGNGSRMGRLSREHHLEPGQAMIFTNHPEVMTSYYPDDIVAGGFYFPVQARDTVILETSSGDFMLSRVINAITTLDDETGEVVINEINYNSADNFDPGDWIELYATGNAVSMLNWVLRDDDDQHGFAFPLEAIIPAGGYMVVAEDPDAFSGLFPDVGNVFGPIDFGFSGSGDDVRLFNPSGALIDAVTYDDVLPWPEDPDGNGPTLELINPFVDNSDAQFWRASNLLAPHGSPGGENSVYTPSDDPIEPIIVQDWRIVNVYPNPFNSETRIEYLAPRAERTVITIYDLLGRVTQQIPVQAAAGLQTAVWRGDTGSGEMAASGVYFVRIGNRAASQMRKVVLLR
jgi:hypothetical protein